jgi:hypothetical protein
MNRDCPITIIEPPFLEPSITRPDVWYVASMASQIGFSARVLDLNVALYRALLRPDKGILQGLAYDMLVDAYAQAFFVDPAALNESIGRGAESAPIIPPKVHKALANRDFDKLAHLSYEALAQFDGAAGKMPCHAEYIVDQEMLNAMLAARVHFWKSKANLSLSHFSLSLNHCSIESLLVAASSEDGILYRLYDFAFGHSEDLVDLGRVLVVISQETQLLPGIALAAWLRRKVGVPVTLTGDRLDIALRQRFCSELLNLADGVLAYRFEYGGRAWLLEDPHAFLLSQDTEQWPELSGHEMTLKPLRCIVADPKITMPLGPLPVATMRVTRRCYWSQCRYCLAAALVQYPSYYASMSEVIPAMDSLPGRGCSHVQFLDYALPPALVRALSERKKGKVRWAAQLRFERSLFDPQLFRRLHESGCVQLSWGFESASPRLLANAKKGGELRPYEKGQMLRMSAEAGISNHLFVIAGLPGETEKDFLGTMRFFENHVDFIDGAEVYAFQLRPGTCYHSNADEYGLVPMLPQWGWQSNVSYKGFPSMQEAEERARVLSEALLPLAVKSHSNDFLEGHLVLCEEIQ